MTVVVPINVTTAQEYQDALEKAYLMPAAADVTASKAETDRLKQIKPAATVQTLDAALTLAATGNVSVLDSIEWRERIANSGTGWNVGQLIDAGSSGARPAANAGYIFHVGAAGLYIKALFPFNFITLEQFGAVGDYDPDTGIGTNNTPAIAAIKSANLGLQVKVKSNAKYKITDSIDLYSGMNWEGDFTCEFYPDFSVAGKKMIETPDSLHKDVSIKGITLVRIGNNAEHGAVIDALEDAYFHVRVISDGTSLGGAFGVSPFYPINRPSKNVNALIEVVKGGNFGLQYGNVSGGSMEVISLDTQREVLGLEPYTLGKADFTSITANQITYTAHGMISGDPILYSAQGNTVISGLTNGDFYFAIVIDANTIKLAKTTEQAWDGTAITLGSVTGTQRIYRAGLLENIIVKGVRNKTRDLPSAGSLTGVTIVTATSGGYHRNISISGLNKDLNNPTSGTQNVNVMGARNIRISGCNLLGGTSSLQVTRGYLQDVRDSTGDIDPTPALEILPDVEISNNQILGASVKGIAIEYGRAVVKNNIVKSGRTGAIGIYMSAAAESRGSRAENNIADIPNGQAFDLKNGTGNIDLNTDAVINKLSSRAAQTSKYFAVNLLTTTNDVCGLNDLSLGSSNYSGMMHITAKAVNAGNTETSSYFLNVVKKASAPAGELALINSLGLITGGGTTHPSFTFTIASNRLIATPIGSTTQNRTWYFWITTIGDLVTIS